jgi:hypothetical protein
MPKDAAPIASCSQHSTCEYLSLIILHRVPNVLGTFHYLGYKVCFYHECVYRLSFVEEGIVGVYEIGNSIMPSMLSISL